MTALTREQTRLSRRIAMILRHRPESAGVTLDPQPAEPPATAVVPASHLEPVALP